MRACVLSKDDDHNFDYHKFNHKFEQNNCDYNVNNHYHAALCLNHHHLNTLMSFQT